LFPHYRHHRPLTLLEALPWMRAGWRKFRYVRKERPLLARLTERASKRYFLVPLQVHNDAQVSVHSPYADVGEFIEETVASFAQHAPRGTMLVIKHHPMDRGYHDYSKQVERLRQQFGLGERLAYIHDLHLPTLLDHAAGVVVINSTVGLSALMHGAPTVAMGSALYDIEGMTYQGGLDRFWKEAATLSVDQAVLNGFRVYLQRRKLINGNYYKRLATSELATGLLWPAGCKMPVVDRFDDAVPDSRMLLPSTTRVM
jgi:capsular polysaccharide export protein